MALEKFRAPALPFPTDQYSRKYLEDVVRALRLYFQQLDSSTPNQAQSYRADNFYGGNFQADDLLADTVEASKFIGGDIHAHQTDFWSVLAYSAALSALQSSRIISSDVMANNYYGNNFYGSGRFLSFPYNQFLSNVDQTAPDLDTRNAVELEVTNFADGIYIAGANDDEITFTEPGVYSITYSLSFKSISNSGEFIDIWIEYEGTDYADSNTRFYIPPRRNATDPSYLIAVTTIDGVAQNANDYIRIMWHPSSLDVVLEHLPAVTASAGVTPNIPATPAAIVQASFISAEYPIAKRVAPLPVFGFGELGRVTVATT